MTNPEPKDTSMRDLWLILFTVITSGLTLGMLFILAHFVVKYW